MRFRDRPAGLRRLRPLRSLFWQALGGTLAFLLPVSAALLILTVPSGPWPLVVILQAIVILAFLASYFSYLRLGFWVGSSGIAERGFFGLTAYIPREQIGSLVFVNTYNGLGTEPVPQLFICDEDGRQLLRMRGQFWSQASMNLVSDVLDIPVTYLNDEVSTAELLDSHPGLLYWFERHPVLGATATAAAIAAAGAAAWAIWAATTSQ